MNCKVCKEYNWNVIEVLHKITEKKAWLCFSCWATTKKYKLNGYTKL